MTIKCKSLIAVISLLGGCIAGHNDVQHATWAIRGGSKASIRYSSLNHIDTTNVRKLHEVWSFHTGGADTEKNSQIQANPIIVDGILFGTSPDMKVFALNATTGEEQWIFNPFPDSVEIIHWLNVNRGVTFWQDRSDRRIFFTAGPWLYALNAENGKPVKSFGKNGKASLKQGFAVRAKNLYVVSTSPGVIYNDLIIIGSRVSEGADAAPGDIRAYNVRTGELKWTFHTIPHPGEFGYDTWKDPHAWKQIGGANSWPGMALDEERGIVYIPTGSASPDFYGGNRKGSNLFANCLLALDAATGKRIWHFQTVHHDLWDRDLPSAPSLVTIKHEGRNVDAVAQTTKSGFVFLFERETGNPLFSIEERPVPTRTKLKREEVWPSQPIPTRPKPFMRQHMGRIDINPYVSEAEQRRLRAKLSHLNSDHLFAPPSLEGTLMLPGFDGGAEWGGSAFDPKTGVLYVNSNEIPWIMTMVPTDKKKGRDMASKPRVIGKSAYMQYCISCHGPDRKGGGDYPSLIEIKRRYTPGEILDLINSGRRMMPGFAYVSENEKKAIVDYLIDEVHFEVDPLSDKKEITSDEISQTPYTMTGYEKFRTPEGYPAISPPWGTLNAIDLNTGEYIWRIPLGEYPALKSKGIPPTGTENYGGPVVTSGGLVFIAATPDKKIRAFNKRTGDLLWEHQLPAAGFATPAVFKAKGRQFIVIACGGGKLDATSGDTYVAFSLEN